MRKLCVAGTLKSTDLNRPADNIGGRLYTVRSKHFFMGFTHGSAPSSFVFKHSCMRCIRDSAPAVLCCALQCCAWQCCAVVVRCSSGAVQFWCGAVDEEAEEQTKNTAMMTSEREIPRMEVSPRRERKNANPCLDRSTRSPRTQTEHGLL